MFFVNDLSNVLQKPRVDTGQFVESADREPGQQRVIEDSTAGVVTWFTILTLHSEPEATNQVIAAPSAIDSLNVRPIAIAS
jgi:hypothetical protein